MIFETDLNYQTIENASEEQLFAYIKENFVSPNISYIDGMSFERSVKIMKVLCNKMLKITPSPEQWVFLLADCERLLCEACAGAGKTTMAQLRSVKDKIIHGLAGHNILALAYNTHAVEDMKSRHDFIIRKLNNLNIPELRRDANLSCHTFHSFCKSWVEDYIDRFKITNLNSYLMTETDRHEAMQLAVGSFKKQTGSNIYVNDAIIEAFLSVYSYIQETLREERPEEWKLCPSMSDLAEFSTDKIKDIFGRYNKWKSLKRKMDFSDLVNHMYELCCDKDILRRIRTNYQVFILDEYQDFTPSMLRIIKIIMEGDDSLGISPFNEGRLTCIGDGDQSIYGFRGTDPDNCVRFKEMYNTPGHVVKVTAMSENRRCPSEIIDYAKTVIESNSRRINKPIRAIKSGGQVKVSKYYSVTEEMDSLIKKVKTIAPSMYHNTCICYRNQSSSFMLGLRLAEANIPFRIAKGHAPLTDTLSQSIFDVLNMLSYPDIQNYIERALYKVVPKSSTFTRATIHDILDAEKESMSKTGEFRPFYDLDYPTATNAINGFAEAIQHLKLARNMHRYNKPMSAYVPGIIHLIRKYYLDWQLTKSNILTKEYIDYITAWFSRDICYDDFMKQYHKLLNDMEEESDRICLTTFHGLKGLEFTNMFIIDLNDTIFPGTELNQSKDLTANQKDVLECEARRLFYVALTRSKENLDLYFDVEVPSRYIRFFTENTGLAEAYNNYLKEENGYLISNVEDNADISSEDIDSLNDFDDLADDFESPEIPLVVEAEPGPTEVLSDLVEQPTSFFDQALIAETEKENRLRATYGNENYDKISTKSTVRNILDRVLSEGNHI